MSDPLQHWPTIDMLPPPEIVVAHSHITDFVRHGPGTLHPWWATIDNPRLAPGDKIVFVLHDHTPKYMSRVIATVQNVHRLTGEELNRYARLDGWWLIEYLATWNDPKTPIEQIPVDAEWDRQRRIRDYVARGEAERRKLPWWKRIFTRRTRPVDTLQSTIEANPNYPYYLSRKSK